MKVSSFIRAELAKLDSFADIGPEYDVRQCNLAFKSVPPMGDHICILSGGRHVAGFFCVYEEKDESLQFGEGKRPGSSPVCQDLNRK